VPQLERAPVQSGFEAGGYYSYGPGQKSVSGIFQINKTKSNLKLKLKASPSSKYTQTWNEERIGYVEQLSQLG
jgi:hypothetical protein